MGKLRYKRKNNTPTKPSDGNRRETETDSQTNSENVSSETISSGSQTESEATKRELIRNKMNKLGVRENRSSATNSRYKIYACVAFVSFVIFINGMNGEFVHDDIPAIVRNKDVLGETPFYHIFMNDFWGFQMGDLYSHKSYRPVTTITFRLNTLLFGLAPFSFHLMNVILHSIASVLFVRVCFDILKMEKSYALVAGLMFAVHPIHTEAVTGIVGRADVLSSIFLLSSLIAYHGYGEGNAYTFLSIFFGFLSMYSKETGFMVFTVNLAFDIYKSWPVLWRPEEEKQATSRVIWRRIIIYTISLVLLLSTRLLINQGTLPEFSEQDNPASYDESLLVRMMTYFYLAAFNWWMIICPIELSHDWQFGSIPLVTSTTDCRNVATIVALTATVVLLKRCITDIRSYKHVTLVMGTLLLILPHIPSSNLFFTVGFVIAERLLYVPSMGHILLMVCGMKSLCTKSRLGKALVYVGVIAMLMFGAAKTYNRNQDWSDTETLIKAGLKTLPHNAKMHYNYGNFLKRNEKFDMAVHHYYEALKLWPSYVSAHNNLGTILEGEEAEKHFLEAISYSNSHANSFFNLGQLYKKIDRNKSIEMIEKCLSLSPDSVSLHFELIKLKSDNTIGPLLKNLINLEPEDIDHYIRYARWLQKYGLLTEALEVYLSAFTVSEKNGFKDKNELEALRHACLIFRTKGQKTRLLQLILRWYTGKWLFKGGISKYVYLFQWVLRHEISIKANYYSRHLLTPEELSHKKMSCMETSKLKKSTPPKIIDKYNNIVKPYLTKPGNNYTVFYLSNCDLDSKEYIYFNTTTKTNDVQLIRIKNIIDTNNNNDTFECNKTDCFLSSLPDEDRLTYVTFTVGQTVVVDKYNTFLKCNSTDYMYKINLQNDRCIHAARVGNILKICKLCHEHKKTSVNRIEYLSDWISKTIIGTF